MRVVMLELPRKLLDERRRLGLDRWDEVWEGELHMVPPPHEAHQRLNDRIGTFFELHWEERGSGRSYAETGVRRPDAPAQHELGADVPGDYRTPDRSFLLPERYDLVQGGWIVGGPDAVLEIVSPGDESRAKLPFYIALGVREVILLDRDTRAVELLRASRGAFVAVPPDADGWIVSEVLGTRWRREEGAAGPALRLQRLDDPSAERVVRP